MLTKSPNNKCLILNNIWYIYCRSSFCRYIRISATIRDKKMRKGLCFKETFRVSDTYQPFCNIWSFQN